jgi:hypothetical protein
MNPAKQPTIIKPLKFLLLVFGIIYGLEFLLLMKVPNGYWGEFNIKNIFSVFRYFIGFFLIPPIIFKATNNKIIKSLSILVLMIFFLLLVLELFSFILVHFNIVDAQKPSYRIFKKISKPAPFYADINKEWGIWRYSDSTSHTSSCYNVKYTRNSVGAADIERPKQTTQKRVIFLGDSFIDGYTTTVDNRISNRAEKATGVPHLNFGCGSMGTIQYSLVYKHLAKTFSHEAVVVFTLPGNDFEDNEDIGEMLFYRPLLVGKYPNYTLTHNFGDITKSDAFPYNQMNGILHEPKLTTGQRIKARLVEHTFLFNLIEKIISTLKPPVKATLRASYFNTVNTEQWERMKYSFEEIDKDANGSVQGANKYRKIIIVALPALHDLQNRAKRKSPMVLSNKLKNLCDEKGWGYIDMLEYFYAQSNSWKHLYLSCDPHWSAAGHQLATKGLLENKQYQDMIKTLK